MPSTEKQTLFTRFSNYAVLPDDDELMKTRKSVMMVFYACVFLLQAACTVVVANAVAKVLAYIMIVVTAAVWFHMVYKKQLSAMVIMSYVAACSMLVVFYDFATAAQGTDRAWPIMVILIDILLVTRVNSIFSKAVVAVTVIYLTITALESAFRFGIYDAPFTSSQKWRKDNVDCETLPCKNLAITLQNYLIYCIVFLLDFYFTRGFADNVAKEKAKVEASVETAEKIAQSLANFDLDAAEDDLIDEVHNLPPPLHAAFDNILQNLKAYRPFLPDALFEGNGSSRDGDSNPLRSDLLPPGTSGTSDSRVAIVFTDIQGSTSIWEACPGGMKRALKLHNKTIRRYIDLHQGYEVKTIGDAFMVAFEAAADAVDFGIAVQRSLVECSWPGELLELPTCERDADGLWGGLRVRIGVHCGEAEAELNAVTGRFDYFGNTVNVAARVEAASVGGGVAVTPEVLAEVTDRTGFVEIPVGSVSLKGVSGSKKLSVLIPEELRGRRSQVEGMLRSKKGGEKPSSLGSQHSNSSRVMAEQHAPTTRLEHIANVTVGCVEVRTTSDYSTVNERVCRILHALDRSGGTVVAVVGPSITVGWNTAKRTLTHFENSLRFASLVLGKHYTSTEVCMGLSTGPVVSATIGSHGQRFVTVMGDCVKVCGSLAATAAEMQTCALFASSSLTHFFAGLRADLKSILRPVVTWEALAHSPPPTVVSPRAARPSSPPSSPHAQQEEAHPLVLYEVSVLRLYDTDLTSMVKHEDSGEGPRSPRGESWCWSDSYWTAFTAGSHEVIAKHADMAGDAIAQAAARLMQQPARVICLRA